MKKTHLIQDLLGIKIPVIQAPMANAQDADLVIAVCKVGGLGSLPCATLSADEIRLEIYKIRSQTSSPFNLNFFCHEPPVFDEGKEALWREKLRAYYLEYGLDPEMPVQRSNRNPFDENSCRIIEEEKPSVVSFHFGLPHPDFIRRIKKSGSKIIASATTVAEALWLEQHGSDGIIAQGIEAGGHRGHFLSSDLSIQSGTRALVPLILEAVRVPVIASGGLGDHQSILAAFELGASAVQLGTAYLFTPEARISEIHRKALRNVGREATALTNLFTGRAARGIVNRLMREIGPISSLAPMFPLAGGSLAPLKAAAELKHTGDFSSLWAGQNVHLGQEMSAGELTLKLMEGI